MSNQKLPEKLSSVMGWKTVSQSQEENEMVTDNEAEVSEISYDWKLGLHDFCNILVFCNTYLVKLT